MSTAEDTNKKENNDVNMKDKTDDKKDVKKDVKKADDKSDDKTDNKKVDDKTNDKTDDKTNDKGGDDKDTDIKMNDDDNDAKVDDIDDEKDDKKDDKKEEEIVKYELICDNIILDQKIVSSKDIKSNNVSTSYTTKELNTPGSLKAKEFKYNDDKELVSIVFDIITPAKNTDDKSKIDENSVYTIKVKKERELTEGNWLPLESNPDALTKFCRRMGLPSKYSFTDFIPDFMAMYNDVCAGVLLFPSGEKAIKDFKKEQNEKLTKNKQKLSKNLFYLYQHDKYVVINKYLTIYGILCIWICVFNIQVQHMLITECISTVKNYISRVYIGTIV